MAWNHVAYLDETSITRIENVSIGDAVLFSDKLALVVCANSNINNKTKVLGQSKEKKLDKNRFQPEDLLDGRLADPSRCCVY